MTMTSSSQLNMRCYKPVHLKSAAGTAGITMKRRSQFEPTLFSTANPFA
jgi:hypothetical protein